MAFAYPIVSYYPDAYDTVPYSQAVGIEFMTRVQFESKRVFSYKENDLALATKAKTIDIVNLPDNRSTQNLQQLAQTSIDIAVIQQDQYFYFSDQDLSLTDNTYTRMAQVLVESTALNKVYSNPSCNIFLKD